MLLILCLSCHDSGSGHLPWRCMFDPAAVHVEFVVNKWHCGSSVFDSALSLSFHQSGLLISFVCLWCYIILAVDNYTFECIRIVFNSCGDNVIFLHHINGLNLMCTLYKSINVQVLWINRIRVLRWLRTSYSWS